MSKRIFTTSGLNWPVSGLGTGLSPNGYMAIVGASSNSITDIDEILITGTEDASTVGAFAFLPIAVAQTGGPIALAPPHSDGPFQSNDTPTTNITYINALTSQPQATTNLSAPKINLTCNTLGGIIRWNASPTLQFTLSGNSVMDTGLPYNTGQAVLINLVAGSGSVTTANVHIIYEPY
jgi:hypothetical protein